MTYDRREAFSLDALHPEVRPAFERLIAMTRAHSFTLKGRKYRFEPFEGFRHPLRQHYLLTTTSSTKSGPWESDHQYGLAVDFACFDIEEASFSWPDYAPWATLAGMARKAGLAIPISWDRGHVTPPWAGSVRRYIKTVAT